MATLKPLDRVGIQMYTSEVHELLSFLRYRIHVLRLARDEWVHHDKLATAQANALPDEFDRDAFEQALRASTEQQTSIFELFETLFAGWARLSLLFHPLDGKGDMAAWRVKRGQLLRDVLGLESDTLLDDRSFRDSWMHFDERLDAAFVGGRIGNRQQFVRTSSVAAAVKHTVRVIDVEALAFHFGDRKGKQRSVTIDQMTQCLDSLWESISGDTVGRRIVQLLPMPPRS